MNTHDERVRQVLGQLHMAAAFAAAVAGQEDRARDHLPAAEDEARTLGDPADGYGFNRMGFGPTNVKLWDMTITAGAAAVRLGPGPGTGQRLDPRCGAGALLKAQDDQAGTRVRSVCTLAVPIAFDTAASGHPGVPSPAVWIAVRVAVSAVTIA